MKKYLVGGAVRDKILGIVFNDLDWLIIDSTIQEMLDYGFIQVNKNIPVFLNPKNNEQYVIARREQKLNCGYKGFIFNTHKVTLKEDLQRRDLTINAMALDEYGFLHDPFKGIEDIKKRIIRHVSPAFIEDPLRILRVARFAAKLKKFGFYVADETKKLLKQMIQHNELVSLSYQLIFKEIKKVLFTDNPEIFFQMLQKLGVYKHILLPFDNKLNVFYLKKAHACACKNYKILFTLLIISLPSDKLIKEILLQLNISKKIKTLCLSTYYYHEFFSNIYVFSSKEILNKLKIVNAIRNPKEFFLLLETIEYMYYDDHRALNSLKIIKQIHVDLLKKNINKYTEIKKLYIAELLIKSFY